MQNSKVILDIFVCLFVVWIHSAPETWVGFVNVVTEEKIGNSLHNLCLLLLDKFSVAF